VTGLLDAGFLTVIGRSRDFATLRELAVSTSVPTNVLLLSEYGLSEFEVDEGECAVYRRDDDHLVNFECNVANFAASAVSLYSVVTDRTPFMNGTFVFVRLEEPEPVVVEFLTELGKAHPDFRFAHVPKTHTYVATRLLNEPFGDSAVNIAVFEFPEKSHYKISHLLPEFDVENLSFNATAWKSLVGDILADVRAGKLEKVLLSEAETPRAEGNMQRLAGTNFWRTVNNESADVFVLFEKPNCQPCPHAYNALSKFATAVLGSVGYELDYLTVSGNKIPGGFPVTSVPAILLYPANDKAHPRVCPYESYDVIAWFAQKYAKEKHAIAFQLPDVETLKNIEDRVAQLSKAATNELVQLLQDTLQDLRSDVALSSPPKEL
jgi:hypothetical protein